ncbi:hypothetical protein EBU71_13120 [bacterium]|nr:hypothetical protein [Candidatus Elulimicrobium humile]
MSRQEVDIGVVGNDGTGDSIREAFRKVNDNFKEIYAIFNLGDSISIQDLDNVPNTLRPNRVLATDGTGLLVKDRELVEGAGIEIDVTDPESIVISSTGGSIITDEEPKLGGPLNASGFGIANVGPPNIDTLNTYLGKHGGSVTINDFVITKGYADKSYLRKTGGSSSVSGQIRVRDEPVNNSEYTLTVNGNINNNIIVNNHGFDSGFDGASYIYLTNGINANGLAQVITVTDSNHFIVGRSYRIESLGNVDFTSIGALRNRVGEIFTLTNTGSIVGYGTVNNLEGGSPSSIPSDTIDGGTPSTTTFTSTYNGGTPAVVVGGSTGTVRPVYFLKYVNTSQLSIHPTFVAAQEGSPKINFNGGTGVLFVVKAIKWTGHYF